HALVGPRQEAEQGREQGRRVQRVGVVVLAEYAAVAHAVLEYVRADLVRRRAPLVGELVVVTDVRQLGSPVERYPTHQLRRHVVLRLSARLPDALVRLPPAGGRSLFPR